MRSIFLTLVVTAFLFSCNNANNDKKAGGSDTTKNTGTGIAASGSMIDAIKDLNATLGSKNKNDIAGIIDFPVADTVMGLYLDDSTFQQAYVADGNQLTKSMFLKYFDTIVRSTYLDEIIHALEILPIDSLKYTNEVSREFKNKDELCTKEFRISLAGSNVWLIYSTGNNDQYIDQHFKKGSKEEVDALEDGGCEYYVRWMFSFDGDKLRFKQFASAG